jgi:hypothetical protein
MHYQLFFPGKTNNEASCLRSVGLADFVEGAAGSIATVEGVPGLMITWSGDAGYSPARQRWIDGEGYRVGFWTDSPCTPADLARASMFSWRFLRMANGDHWGVPVACELPKDFKLVDKAWTKVRKPQFDDFWSRSEVWFRRFLMCNFDVAAMCADAKISESEIWQQWCEFAVFTLRQNYRVTGQIVGELGLLDEETVKVMTYAAVDGMNIDSVMAEWQASVEAASAGLKKSESEVLA